MTGGGGSVCVPASWDSDAAWRSLAHLLPLQGVGVTVLSFRVT